MRNRIILFIIILFCSSAEAQILYNKWTLKKNKQELQTGRKTPALVKLRSECDDIIRQPALSVTQKKNLAPSKDIHDFCTLAIYTWPDSTQKDGLPYIIKDGYPNPEYANYDYPSIIHTCDRINKLVICWYFTDEKKYANKALELIKTWFLNDDTMMNPNLEYCQIIPGHNNNLGYNIFDGIYIARMLDGIMLLENYEGFNKKDRKNIHKWIDLLYKYILTSRHSADNKIHSNNHSENLYIQQLYYMIYLGKKKQAKLFAKKFTNILLEKQLMPDGSMPYETERNRSFHYSLLTLEYITDIVLIAQNIGLDIKNDKTANGATYPKAVEFLSQYIGKTKSDWPFDEIGKWDEEQSYANIQFYRIANRIATKYNSLLENNGGIPIDHIYRLIY